MKSDKEASSKLTTSLTVILIMFFVLLLPVLVFRGMTGRAIAVPVFSFNLRDIFSYFGGGSPSAASGSAAPSASGLGSGNGCVNGHVPKQEVCPPIGGRAPYQTVSVTAVNSQQSEPGPGNGKFVFRRTTISKDKNGEPIYGSLTAGFYICGDATLLQSFYQQHPTFPGGPAKDKRDYTLNGVSQPYDDRGRLECPDCYQASFAANHDTLDVDMAVQDDKSPEKQ